MDIEAIKAANDLIEVIGETVEIRKAGANWRGRADNSLYVWSDSQTYKDFSDDAEESQGDVITWVMRVRRCEFKEAVEWLCDRAKLERPHWSGEGAQQAVARRQRYDALTVAARHFVRCLRRSEEAMAYCASRGWTEETIKAAGLGYVDGDRKGLLGELAMHGLRENDPVVRAVLGIPQGMLVYAHVAGGRVVYVSGRSASGEKRHYNPRAELVGERQAYFNWVWTPRAELVCAVEGQADAITLGQWGVAAVAMAGISPGADLVARLRRHKVVVLGLDQDGAGKKWTSLVAAALGPMTRLVRWPAHDVNDWLVQGGGDEAECQAVIKWSEPYVLHAARQAGETEGLERGEKIKGTMRLVAQLEAMDVGLLRDRLVEAMRIKIRPFNALLKAARGECEQDAGGPEDESEIVLEVAVPGGYMAGHLLEMLVVPPADGESNGYGAQWRTRFACRWPDGRIGETPYVDVERTRYVPVTAHSRMLTERVVSFPSELGEEMTLRELVKVVQTTIHKYVDVEIFFEFLSTYYVLFTWLYDSFNTLPYLRLLGDAGTGKSRFLQVVGAMCYRPIAVTGATTVSPVFRTLDVYRGTFVADEFDFRASDEAAEIIKILNTGYQRQQGIVLRSGDKNVGFETEIFVTYGPKIIGTRKRFQDWALESRCLTHEMGGPTTRTDIPIDLPRRFFTEEAVAVRNKLLRFRLVHWRPEIELDYERAEIDSVEPRLRQVTVALLTLIDDDGLREDLREFIKQYNRQMIVERGMTPVAKVLDAIVGLQMMTPTIALHFPLKTLAQAANILIDIENEGEPSEDKEEDEKGKKKLSPRGVGHIVRKQLHLRTERLGEGRSYVACWDHDRIEGLRKRFGVDEEWARRTAGTLKSYLKVEDVPPGF